MSGARIGVLGGTFDPIHVGHLAAADAVRRALALDQVLLVPARHPPHRGQHPDASPYHRFAMVALAVAGADGLVASDLELGRPGPSYTSTTLRTLHARGLPAAGIYFITGADAFAEITTWKDYPEILELAHFVVVDRPGVSRASLPAAPAHAVGVVFVEAATPEVSSTAIRRRIRAGESIAGLVPDLVGAHIERHGLYRGETGKVLA